MGTVNARRALSAVGVFFLIAFALFAERRALVKRAGATDQESLYLPRSSALKAMSLGHTELAADLVFIRALTYFGGQFQDRGRFEWLDSYLETILALDPTWKTPYRWAGVATMYNGREITNQSVSRSSHFLELGVKQFPSDWELPFMLGCNFLFELKTDDPAVRASWDRQGAEWIRHAAIVGGGPPWIPLLAATILHKEGRDDAALAHLEEVYQSTSDEKTRTEVKNRLLSLHSKIDFARAESARRDFDALWMKNLPYAPSELFVVMGPRRGTRMDLTMLARDALPETEPTRSPPPQPDAGP